MMHICPTCFGLRRYPSRKAVRSAVHLVRRLHRHARVEVFYCLVCQGWHIWNQKKTRTVDYYGGQKP